MLRRIFMWNSLLGMAAFLGFKGTEGKAAQNEGVVWDDTYIGESLFFSNYYIVNEGILRSFIHSNERQEEREVLEVIQVPGKTMAIRVGRLRSEVGPTQHVNIR